MEENKPDTETQQPQEHQEEVLEDQYDSDEEQLEEDGGSEDQEASDDQPDDEFSDFELADESELKNKKFKITLSNGQELEVPWKELRSGYFRYKDYHKKTSQVSKLKKEYQAGLEEAQEAVKSIYAVSQGAFDGYDKQIQQAHGKLKELEKSNLTDKEVIEYNRRKAALDRLVEQRQLLEQGVNDLQKDWDAKLELHRERVLKDEGRKLEEAMPELQTPKYADRFRQELYDYAAGYFGEDELKDFFQRLEDHRYILILRDAVRYRALKKNSREPVKVNKPNKMIRSDRAKISQKDKKMGQKAAAKRQAMQGGSRNTSNLLKGIMFNN